MSRLIGLGVGPGDPELLTLKAVRALREADVLAYVAANDEPSFARRIAAPHLAEGRHEIAIAVPMGAERALIERAYDDGARRIRTELERGHTVAVLCEGDPLLYGSFIQLLARLDGLARIEIVPGLSSVMAASAAARLPLATGDEVLMLLPATLSATVLERHLRHADAAAILKIGRHLSKVREVLERTGLLERAVYVAWASLPEQQVERLADLKAERAPYFSLVLVHRRDPQGRSR